MIFLRFKFYFLRRTRMKTPATLVGTLVVVSLAFKIGIEGRHNNEENPLIVLLAFSVYDLALFLILLSATILIGRRPGMWIVASIQVCEILKIIVRIFAENVEEIASISYIDDLWYFASLVAFASALVHQNLWKGSHEEEVVDTVTVGKLLGLVRGESVLLSSAIVFLFVAAVAQAAIPHYIGQALDGVKDRRDSMPALSGLLFSTMIMSVFSTLRGSSFILLGARVNVNLRSGLFRAILRQDMGFFDKSKTGDLSSRLTQDCQKVCDQVQLNVNYFVRHLISLVVTLGFMVGLSWRLTCLALISIPFTAVLVHKYGEIMKEISKEIQDKLADCNAASEETLSSIRTVRSFAAEGLESDRFSSLLRFVYIASKKSAIQSIPFMTASRALPYLSLRLFFFYGSKKSHANALDSGSLIAFVLYLDILNGCFSAMGDIYGSITAALGAADKVFGLLEKRPDFEPTEFPTHPMSNNVEGRIELRDVCLTYPSRPERSVLNSISITVPSGSVVALVGGSGQGKSSCLALLQRWYLESSGQVLLDGVPVRRYDVDDYHRIVTCVNQEPLLFARTIRENILFGLMNPGDETVTLDLESRVVEAAKLANAHDFITSLPHGYDTEVGMRGVQLSGGQKQRIAIARALVRRPKVLLLDEATSALDAESEHQVQAALDSMMSGQMTVIVVAHRLSTVRNADIIYVVEKGQVVEKGNHDSLMAQGESSAYYKLVQSQLTT